MFTRILIRPDPHQRRGPSRRRESPEPEGGRTPRLRRRPDRRQRVRQAHYVQTRQGPGPADGGSERQAARRWPHREGRGWLQADRQGQGQGRGRRVPVLQEIWAFLSLAGGFATVIVRGTISYIAPGIRTCPWNSCRQFSIPRITASH